MQEYRYPKSGYTLLAVKLIYGKRSRHVEQFSVFGLPPHDENRLQYSEEEHARQPILGPGINSCRRAVRFSDGRELISTSTQGTGINIALLYMYLSPRVASVEIPEDAPRSSMAETYPFNLLSVLDTLFSQKEYEYFERSWDTQVQYKVDILAKLIRALDTGDENLYPMFVSDFPEIAAHLLSKPNPVPKRDPIWP